MKEPIICHKDIVFYTLGIKAKSSHGFQGDAATGTLNCPRTRTFKKKKKYIARGQAKLLL